MNLGQLLNSNAKVRKGYSKDKGPYKSFSETDIGNIISINTRYHTDERLGIIHMLMYMTASEGTESPIQLFSKAGGRKRTLTADRKNILSTYTVGISFREYWEIDVPLEDIQYEDETYNYWTDPANRSGFREELVNTVTQEARDYFKKKYGDKYAEELENYLRVNDTDRYEALQARYKSKHANPRFNLDNQVEEFLKSIAHKYNKQYSTKGLDYIKKEKRESDRPDMVWLCTNILVRPHTYEVDGDMVHIHTKITLDSPVRVNCTCSQFYYTFAWYNADHQALIGSKPPAYVKSNGRKLVFAKLENNVTVRNVDKRPGLCKHLQFFISYLMNEGIIETGDSRWSRQVYGSNRAMEFVRRLIDTSEQEGTLDNAGEIKQAKQDHKEFIRDLGRAANQNKLFGG